MKLEEALGLSDSIGDIESTLTVLNDLAEVRWQLNDREEAISNLEEAVGRLPIRREAIKQAGHLTQTAGRLSDGVRTIEEKRRLEAIVRQLNDWQSNHE